MTILSRKRALARAMVPQSNKPGFCQAWTRGLYNAPSVGDVDRDKDADAVDGWKSEPEEARHTSRKPPLGVPVAFSGGRNGFGHRAIATGNGSELRSPDAPLRGHVGTVTIEWIEKNWGMKYPGWSETISGQKIPNPHPPKPKKLTVLQVAKQVIDGDWGNGPARAKKLTEAGYDAKKVQAKVNELLKK